MAKQFFVTGTDTGVGKTMLSALLCVALDGYYWKPIQTGTEEDSDSRIVAELAELPPERIIPEAYRFAPAVSPHLAARLAGVQIELGKIPLPVAARNSALIVEGAGGAMVPINERELMVDLIRHLGLPVLLAARSSLGTINHTLLSLAALRAARVEVAGVVMIGKLNAENLEAIDHFGQVRVLGEIPWMAQLNRISLLEIFATRFDRGFFTPVAKGAVGS